MDLNKKIIEFYKDSARALEVKKGDCLIEAGVIHSNLFYVDEGLFKVSFFTHEGREHNRTFVWENMFYIDLFSFWEKRPSVMNVTALENAKVRTLSMNKIEKLCEYNAQAKELYFEYIKQRMIRHEYMMTLLQSLSGRDRYLEFVKTVPDLEKRLPAQEVARFLGLTPVSLSRIKKEIP